MPAAILEQTPKFKNIGCTHCSTPESKLDGVKVSNRTPDFSYEAFLGHINVAEVQSVIDCLHLAHLYEPDTDILCRSLQNPLPMILCLVQHLEEG